MSEWTTVDEPSDGAAGSPIYSVVLVDRVEGRGVNPTRSHPMEQDG